MASITSLRVEAGLPRPRTALVGRDAELTRLQAALRGARLVTLTGPGGAGKTRLAIAAAHQLVGAGGVGWVELAAVADPALVADTVRSVVGVAESAGLDATQAIIEAVGDAEVLVCLDNCEHLVAATAELVDRLLEACPGVRVLATSREPLAVTGEAVWPVAPLAVPTGEEVTAAAVRASAAGHLFELRARAVWPAFELADADAAAAARLCRQTGGLPLALELAAARVRVLSVPQIADGIDALAAPPAARRAGPARQQSLRATLDWSHALLADRERAVLRRLGVFPGSFDLPAAQAVAGIDPVGAGEVLDVLGRLVDRSLLTPQRVGEQMRYRLLAPVRGYARERLAAAGEQDAAADAHLGYYGALAERAEPLVSGPGQAAELDRLELEGNNLRVALACAAAHAPRAVEGVRLAASLWRLCALRGHYTEGRRWLDWAATVEVDAPPALRAKALLASGSLAHLQCDYPAAVRRLEAALQRYRDLDDRAGIAATLQVLGSVARERGRYARAEALHREALQFATVCGDELRVAQCHGYLGFAAWLQGQFDTARDECQQARALFGRIADGEGMVWSLLSLSIVARYRGEPEPAADLLTQARDLSRRLGYREGIAWTAHQLGVLALRRAEPDAELLLREALAGHRTLGDRWRAAAVVEDLARCTLARGEDRLAVSLLAAAATIRAEIGTDIAPCEQPDHDQAETSLRERLTAEEFAGAWAHGQATPLGDLLTDNVMSPSPASPIAPAEPARAERLRIRALGEATVYHGDQPLTPAEWGYGKPRELLFLLLSSPPRTKVEIGRAIWPDLDDGQLRNAFHTALRDLRRALGDPGWVRFAAGRYSLDRARDHRCDLEIFDEALAAARRAGPADAALPHLRRAIDAYGGEFGAGLPDTGWVLDRRTHYARQYASALAATGRLLAGAGRLPEAVETYRRAVRHDPLDEAAHRQLISALIRTGQAAQAAQTYEALAARLRDELGIAPAAETTALYEKLRRAH
jgi:predicted ATPase/DNA-binding SARP family transcriptional activator